MTMHETIENKVRAAFLPQHLELLNESHNHSGPATESHFKLTLVSEKFNGESLVKRHQSVYKILAEELNGEVHALALHLYNEQEWQDKNSVSPESPNCLGGSLS